MKKRRTSWAGRLLALIALPVAVLVIAWPESPDEVPYTPVTELLIDNSPDRDVDWATLTRESDSGDFGETIVALANGQRIKESQIQKLMQNKPEHLRWFSYGWRVSGTPITTVAPGSDQKHHFVNSFLLGFVPMPDVPAWVPHHVIAKRKQYMTDKEQYGKDEMWQTSREAMASPRGDCEDHAIALADWLIGLGKDARVVLGRARGEGHAWVVVIDNGSTWLLESTAKRRMRHWSYPIAGLHTEYVPEEMFDRQRWWRNSGGPTVDYEGGHWQQASTVLQRAGGG